MMRRPYDGLRWAWFVLLTVTGGCVVFEAPYEAPVNLSVEVRSVDESTLIPYRTLVESDFKAATSTEKPKYADALIMVFIRVQPPSIRIVASTRADSSFEAVPDSFYFEARMSQTLSWINPKHTGTLRHILDHEQVHFAISELAARRANSQMDAIRSRIRAVARVDSVACRLAEQRFNEEVARVRKEAADRDIEYDKNTKNGQRFYRNDLWSERIRRELSETARSSKTLPR